MAIKGSAEILVEAHEERIQALERSIAEFNKDILPALARLEASIDSGLEKVYDSLEDDGKRLDAIETNLKKLDEPLADIKVLTVAHQERIERNKALKKWGFSLLATIIGAAVLAALGLG